MRPDTRTLDDRYELRALLGKGSMGHVWQAWDGHLKRPVAVKVISPERLTGHAQDIKPEDIAARFRREAELGARFSHPGIPTLYDAQLTGTPKELYMVWELVLGQDLADILVQEGGRLPLTRAVSVAAQIADILALTHTDPVIHRDLKPANIMITGSWKVKLLDFGVAAVFGTANPRLTQAGHILGTVAYMAPEQFNDRGDIIPQTDLYALGCLLYQMLTGTTPFTGDHATVMDGHRNRPPTSLHILRPDAPADIGALVLSLLAKEPAARPASARRVLDQLLPHCADSQPAADPALPTIQSRATEAAPAPELPLNIRTVQAMALFDEGRFGDALPAYTALGKELTAAGADHVHEAAECRAKAAFCHLRLGNQEQALIEYEALDAELCEDDAADASLSLEVRCRLGLLQEATGQVAALKTLADLYPILAKTLGRDAPETTDVRAALNRLNKLGSALPSQPPALRECPIDGGSDDQGDASDDGDRRGERAGQAGGS
ncbi:protein kinase domain-containing protein, partial [Streptomyces sp. NPDC055059]